MGQPISKVVLASLGENEMRNTDFEIQHASGATSYLMQKTISAAWSPTGERQTVDYHDALLAAHHGASMDAPTILPAGSWIADEYAEGPFFGIRE